MFLIPEGIIDSVINCDILPGHLSDHSLLTLVIRVDDFRRGPGVWKFNNKLLLENTFCESTVTLIEDTLKNTNHLNPGDKWETLKMKIGAHCKRYSKKKSRKQIKRFEYLRKRKSDLEKRISEYNVYNNEIHEINQELELISMEKAKSSIFRSQCTYAKDGEKCSEYFLSLEKKRYNEKNMKCVIKENGVISNNQKDILEEQTRFYKKLYSKDEKVKFVLKPEAGERILDSIESDWCERVLTKDEFFDALMTLKSNKVPGLDGLTVEFYRKFWNQISDSLINMYNYSFDMGILPESVRQGLISLLPKRNKDTRYVKNMRPLTLLNNDYKILSKALDNRLREILPKIIPEDQTGFVKGRKICHNIRKSMDLMDIAKKDKIPMVILSIDMEKCFDRLEHTAILESLRYFNFGPKFTHWISLFYTNFNICTQNFGFLSKFWKKERGSNQGCPLSPGIYLLMAEIMANKLRNNKEIRGIKVGGIEYLISQFTDDTDLYLWYDQKNIDATFKTLSGIEENTGLRISYDKTTMYRVGSLANTDTKLITPRKINWSNEYINTLGVNLYNDNELREQNLMEVVNKMEAISNMWYYRTMSLMGKVVVINSLMASLFVYRMQTIPLLSDRLAQKIDDMFNKFLWHGKKPKISLQILQKKKEDGGLGLVDIRAKHKSLLFNWILDTMHYPKIQNLAKYFLGPYIQDERIWQF